MMSEGRIDLLKRKDELKRPLILDGALGSLLQQRGIEAEEDLWMSHANLFFPKTVVKLHREYIQAGADIITTNTFRTNPYALKSSNEDIYDEDFVRKSVELAKVAREREEMDIIIAGSNSSAEDCYQKERTIDKNTLEYNHKKHIELLWENGVDVIWNETHSHLDEIEIICEYCSSNNLPFIISLFFDENLRLLSGETLTETVSFISKFSPAAIGFNCVYPGIFKK
jgi:homocysteine S-methyltransferase